MADVNVFETDTHRRVAANCTRPRSAREIAYVLKTVPDPHVDDACYEPDGVQEVLSDLEADGLVVNLGEFDDPEQALKAQNQNKQTIDFTGNKDSFVQLAQHPLRHPFLNLGEDHWVLSKLGHGRLTGEIHYDDQGNPVLTGEYPG